MTAHEPTSAEPDASLTIVRAFPAAAEAVFRAWTVPTLLARWWWPARFRTSCQVDLRPGGRYRYWSVELPDVGILAVSGTYLEVDPPQRLVYTWAWEGSDEPKTRVTVVFSRQGAELTELTLTHGPFARAEERANHIQGWNDCLDRLAAELSGAA
jgi:uncharacterized protein YndB with AHSA1/START domain